MRLGRVVLYIFPVSAVALISFGAWYVFRPHSPAVPSQPARQVVTEDMLNRCIGERAKEVVHLLGLQDAKWFWTDEPPGVLRGASYYEDDGRSVTMYIAEREPLFRRFDEHRDWDYEAFLGCRVGGIQYHSGEVHLDIGPAVPFQWRTPRAVRPD